MTRWVELLTACLVLPCALEILPVRRVLEVVRRLPPRRAAGDDPLVLARIVDTVLARLPSVWHRTCLRRAVVLAAMLRRDGRAAEVMFGVRKAAGGALEAHAWLSCDGADPYLESGDIVNFSPLRSTRRVAP